MATQSKNLNLIINELSDSRHKTITDIAQNFQKLDEVSDVFVPKSPTEGYHSYNTRRWNSNPTTGSYLGWVNIRAGESAPLWQGKNYYNAGDRVLDSTNNSHYYTAVNAGYSGVAEPAFTVAKDATTQDIRGSSTWSKFNYYDINDMVLPSISNGFWYLALTAGNVDKDLEPTWRTIEGETFVDGDVTWEAHRIITWRESGTSSNFRPFGKIE